MKLNPTQLLTLHSTFSHTVSIIVGVLKWVCHVCPKSSLSSTGTEVPVTCPHLVSKNPLEKCHATTITLWSVLTKGCHLPKFWELPVLSKTEKNALFEMAAVFQGGGRVWPLLFIFSIAATQGQTKGPWEEHNELFSVA